MKKLCIIIAAMVELCSIGLLRADSRLADYPQVVALLAQCIVE